MQYVTRATNMLSRNRTDYENQDEYDDVQENRGRGSGQRRQQPRQLQKQEQMARQRSEQAKLQLVTDVFEWTIGDLENLEYWLGERVPQVGVVSFPFVSFRLICFLQKNFAGQEERNRWTPDDTVTCTKDARRPNAVLVLSTSINNPRTKRTLQVCMNLVISLFIVFTMK